MKPGSGAGGSLMALKCLLFCVFGGFGCLFPYLPLHMRKVGLTLEEAHIVSIVAPLVAVLGPLVAGPLADKLGSTSSRNNGCGLRAMLAVSLLLSAISYCLLLAIPTVERLQSRRPAVTFSCGINGAELLQERCMEHSACYHWTKEKTGPLHLSKCFYNCKSGESTLGYEGFETTTVLEDLATSKDYDYSDVVPLEVDMNNLGGRRRRKRDHDISLNDDVDPPHLCVREASARVLCHVYTSSSEILSINASFLQPSNPDDSQESWCKYPLGGSVWCPIPPGLLAPMGHEECQVRCSLEDPYTTAGSVLAESQCQEVVGNPAITFWSYLLVRSVAEIFPAAALTLVNTAVVIATRDTSSGGADVGRQLIFAALGFALFAPLVGFFTHMNLLDIPKHPVYLLAFVAFATLMVVSTLVVVLAQSMLLGAPEWWWSPRGTIIDTGRRCGGQLTALIVVLTLLGAFFGAIDSYLPWHLSGLGASSYLIGLTLTVGALPSIPLLWNSEKLVDYCGHSNILITAFTFYIIRYTGLSFGHLWWTVVCETMEVFTLSLMWVTAILYIRHLVPSYLTATGQAAAVIGHFCIGRSIGALLAGAISQWSDSMVLLYRYGAMSAAVIATVYFVMYHCCLKPRCLVPSNPSERTQSPIVQGTGVLLCVLVLGAIVYAI